MIKQIVTSFLWFFTIAWAWNIVAAMTGSPSVAGLGLGLAAGAFVWGDPLHLIRPARVVERGDGFPTQISQTIQRPV